MTRRIVTLQSPSDVARAKDYLDRAAAAGGYCVEFKKATRTLEQNAKLWSDLADITKARPVWNGVRMSPRIWKSTFMAALNIEQEMAPLLDGPGVIPTGFRSSQLSKQEFSDLLEIIAAFAAREGIKLKERVE